MADLNAAEVNLAVSQATYTQVIGNTPGVLRSAETVDRYLPRSRDDATTLAFKENPAVLAAGFDVDVASTNDPRRRKQPDAHRDPAGQRQP